MPQSRPSYGHTFEWHGLGQKKRTCMHPAYNLPDASTVTIYIQKRHFVTGQVRCQYMGGGVILLNRLFGADACDAAGHVPNGLMQAWLILQD